jgi:hypothetical protein
MNRNFRNGSPSFQPLLAAEPLFLKPGGRVFHTDATLEQPRKGGAPPMRFGVAGSVVTVLVAAAATVGLAMLGDFATERAARLILSPPPSPR